MIKRFEELTKPLTAHEQEHILPAIVAMLQKAVGSTMAISNRQIVDALMDKGCMIKPARIRAIVAHIRTYAIIPCLVASAKGYYVANDRADVMEYCDSLQNRENAIRKVRNALLEQLDGRIAL